jgi:hypothetical protein
VAAAVPGVQRSPLEAKSSIRSPKIVSHRSRRSRNHRVFVKAEVMQARMRLFKKSDLQNETTKYFGKLILFARATFKTAKNQRTERGLDHARHGGGTGLGRVLWECGDAVRSGLAGKLVQRSPSWRLILHFFWAEKKRSLLWNPTRHKKYPKSCRVVGPRCQVYLGFIVRRA